MEIELYKDHFRNNKTHQEQDCYFENKIIYFLEGKLQANTSLFMTKHLSKCKSCHKKSVIMKEALQSFSHFVPKKVMPLYFEKKTRKKINVVLSDIYLENQVNSILGAQSGIALKKLRKLLAKKENLYIIQALIIIGIVSLLIF